MLFGMQAGARAQLDELLLAFRV